jgi:hypothetical protein
MGEQQSAPKPEKREVDVVTIYKCKKHGYVDQSFMIHTDKTHEKAWMFCPYCLGSTLAAFVPAMGVVGNFKMHVPPTQEEIDWAARLVDKDDEPDVVDATAPEDGAQEKEVDSDPA